MCLTCLSSWSRPLEVEPQHRDAPPIDDARIDLAVRVVVRDHLAAAGEADGRAVEAPVVVLQRLAVAAAGSRAGGVVAA